MPDKYDGPRCSAFNTIVSCEHVRPPSLAEMELTADEATR